MANKGKRVGLLKDVPEDQRPHVRGKLGRAASPWGRYPMVDTPKAIRAQAKYRKEQVIREAVKKVQPKKKVKTGG